MWHSKAHCSPEHHRDTVCLSITGYTVREIQLIATYLLLNFFACLMTKQSGMFTQIPKWPTTTNLCNRSSGIRYLCYSLRLLLPSQLIIRPIWMKALQQTPYCNSQNIFYFMWKKQKVHKATWRVLRKSDYGMQRTSFSSIIPKLNPQFSVPKNTLESSLNDSRCW